MLSGNFFGTLGSGGQGGICADEDWSASKGITNPQAIRIAMAILLAISTPSLALTGQKMFAINSGISVPRIAKAHLLAD
jgi:hypothetical protein